MCCYLCASWMDISGLQIPVLSTSYIFKCFRNRRTLHTDLSRDVCWTNCVCGSWFCFIGRLVMEWRRYSGFYDTVSIVLSVLCLFGFDLCTTSSWSFYSRDPYYNWQSVQWYLETCLLAANIEDSCQCSFIICLHTEDSINVFHWDPVFVAASPWWIGPRLYSGQHLVQAAGSEVVTVGCRLL